MFEEIFKLENIMLDLSCDKKVDILKAIAQLAFEKGVADSSEQILKGLLDREALVSTSVGKNVAIPHCKSTDIKKAGLFVIRLQNLVYWEGEDNDTVKFVFSILVSDQSNNLHLKLLSKLAKNLLHDDFLESLNSASTEEELFSTINAILTGE
ncbi:PTS mannose transporter subunit IIAB [Clostridium polyendosporum]|uniref:PTS mannose transporter subunit IIAB n=1 Tax=Clostridium polyendosporum TaxID=69208 RepID=A0A919S348_9CLOT|nr:PTS sugar transporter subunit IIA [Clostridium polyendosporum]GIM30604.1 PTS mannose transporter subunit IIAB [Clostridium polyendosporum]